MNHHTKSLSFFILLFVIKDISPAQIALPSFKYDISSSLPDLIIKIFENAEDSNIDTTVITAFDNGRNGIELEYNITEAANPTSLQSKIIFYDTRFRVLPIYSWHKREGPPFTLEAWKLSDSKIRLSTKRVGIELRGQIRAKRDQYYASYWTNLHFEDFVLDAIRVSKDPNDVKFSFKLTYKSCDFKDDDGRGVDRDIGWPRGELTIKERRPLINYMKRIIPKVLNEYMNRNPQFSQAFYQITKIYDQPFETVSANRNLKNDRHLYYYLIPQTRFYQFYLRNIIIQGLLNFDSLDVERNSFYYEYTRTLLMKNIRGNMTLDYLSEIQKPLDLNFVIDYLSISIKNGTDFMHVEARSYSINRTTGAALTHRQSASIIQKIECALATELMPSKRAWKTCDIKPDIDRIEITNATDWEIIEKKYKEWIPFNQKKLSLMQRIRIPLLKTN
ncbi:uncharacterized protein LOC135834243 [Planococcus citri]|uniref:uncharacterized protein LOC135834243 n=1 Tax=Planococcus citri TaxID=170843 RepID=UPI0031FA0983